MFKVIYAATDRALQAALDYYMANDLPADTVATVASMVGMPNGSIVLILTLAPDA